MKASELAVGDWVMPLRKSIRKPCRVITIDGGTNTCWIDSDEYSGLLPCSELERIPLTPEILEKNGWKHEFDKKDYMVKYDLAVEDKNCWMMWAVKEHNLDIQRQDEKLDMYNLKVQRVCMPCDFVHELQHALRLCGIEKEIII